MKIALAQIDTTIGDFAGNVDLIVKYAECARDRGADLVVFPELALCGYPPRDLVEKPGFIERSQSELLRLAANSAPHSRRWWVTCAARGRIRASRWRMPRLGWRAARWWWTTPKSCCPSTTCLTNRVTLSPARACASMNLAASAWASPFAKTSGTTSISGPIASTPATRWRNASRRARTCC